METDSLVQQILDAVYDAAIVSDNPAVQERYVEENVREIIVRFLGGEE